MQNWARTLLSADAPTYPTPACFQKRALSALNVRAFRKRLNNDSPRDCAETCLKIHDDEDDARDCIAFDFNSRTGACRFFENNSQDDGARLIDSSKTDVYELDESCWRTKNGPPTLPPHVDACASGSKPLMEKVTGWYLRSSGLAFKGIDENKCYEKCLQDKV